MTQCIFLDEHTRRRCPNNRLPASVYCEEHKLALRNPGPGWGKGKTRMDVMTYSTMLEPVDPDALNLTNNKNKDKKK